ncbi:two-component regulator propeller domain-containing protein [uncultured Draconibacterium sp.]|uniref:two-component regulator propeller domain-containing protein n=1 Tax=uncultured Draconibacterium sp. TaxID=1573823 RepID=UPI00326110D5
MRNYLLTILIILSFASSAQNYVFDKITTLEGLSQNDVNTIYQDKQGFLWIGTHDGLNRYDGYSFRAYHVNPLNEKGIHSNLVFDIAEDESGNLWLATSDEGICRFNVQTEVFTSFYNSEENPDIFLTNQIVKVLPTHHNTLWVASGLGITVMTFDGNNYNTRNITAANTPELEDDQVSDLATDVYGRIWAATRSGLYVISENDDNFNVTPVLNNIGGNIAKDIIIGDDEIIVSYLDGIYRVTMDMASVSDVQFQKISDLNVNCLLLSKRGDLFAGNDLGLYVFERNQQDQQKFNAPLHFIEGWETNSLSKNVVVSLFEDKSGIIWIGTNGGGLNKYNPKKKKFRHFNKTRIEGSLSYNKIRAIHEDRSKNIWVGTEGGGINFLSNKNSNNYTSGWKKLDVNTGSSQNRVYSFLELNDKGPVEIVAGVGYPQVIAKLKENYPVPDVLPADDFAEVKSSVFTSLKTNDGTIWLGTYGRGNGLIRISSTSDGKIVDDFKPNGQAGCLSSFNIRSLLQDCYGNLWVGTDRGLNLLLPDEQKKKNPNFIQFKKGDSPGKLSHNYILPIFQAGDSTIWVGTMGGGLNRVNYNNDPEKITFEAVTTADGLPNNVIKGILEDDYGFLWISSNKGLTRFDVEDRLFISYGINDGLQDYEFGELACCKLSSGEMLFGGVNGINAFFPKDIISDMSTPEVAFTDFQVLNQSVVPGDMLNGRVVLEKSINHTEEVRLKYAENSFAIHFSSLHFSAPAQNTYKYMLEGFDNDWIRKDASDRIAKYTNLRPGTYTFKVLASNNDGVWADDPKILKVRVTPPWYLSIAAWVVYVILFLTSMWFFQKYSLIRIKQRNELLMEHFEKEKIQELSQMKLRFFTNISHEFRTPLTLIIGPLEKLIKQGKELPEKKIAESYAIMHRNASILLRLINQLIDFRKFEQGKMILRASNTNVVAFLKDVFLSFSELAEKKNINYEFATQREKIDLWFDDDKLERIMYNLLSNAFKFTAQGGKIQLLIDEDDKYVVIKVADNGAGIPKEMQKHIFERFYQADRIKNRKVGSTGIGLSFIKGLIEMHKGEITFESEVDKGTTFTVKLPKGNAHLETEQMRAVSRDQDTAKKDFSFLEPVQITEAEDTEEKTKKNKVLVVEDNFELRSFIKDSLKDKFEVHCAENGKEGLEKVHEINPDVVVSDIMMPAMNGFELCETIKTDENISHIPVVLLTAKSNAENRVKGYNLGADGYISKPFNIEVLEARIQNLIESREKLRKKLRGTISVEPSEVTTTSMDEKFLKRILKIIEENIPNSDFTVEQLASDYGMSQIVLNKKLKALTGLTAKAFIRNIRMKRAAQLFKTGNYSVTDVTYEVGFSDLKYFRNCFKDEFGMSPSEYIKAHKPEAE